MCMPCVFVVRLRRRIDALPAELWIFVVSWIRFDCAGWFPAGAIEASRRVVVLVFPYFAPALSFDAIAHSAMTVK